MNVNRIVKAAIIIMIGSVLSRVLGLGREVVISDLFGRGADVDAFTIAANVSTIVYDLLISGMISAALVPVLSEYSAPERRAELGRVLGTILTGAAIFLVVAVALLEGVAGPLVAFMAPDHLEIQAQAVGMTRLVLPGVVFLGVSGILTAALYSLHRFTFPALAMSALNAAIILAALGLGGLFGINSLVIGMVAGAACMVLIQAPGLRDVPLRPALALGHPAVRQILVLYAPVALSVFVTSVMLVVDRRFATQVGEGSISAMRYATTLIQFALGMVSAAISLAALPSLSQHFAAGDTAAYKRTLAFGLRLVTILVLPAAAGLFFLGIPVVQLVFEHGQFTAGDVPPTVLALACYCLGLPFGAIDQILIFGFYSRKNTIIPITVGVVQVAVYFVVALSLIEPLGMAGLVLANSAMLLFHALVTGFLLYRVIGGLPGLQVGATAVKAGLAALFMGLASFAAWVALDAWLRPADLFGKTVALGIPALLGGALYVGALALLRVRDLGVILARVRARLPGGRGAADEAPAPVQPVQ
jgi:putative peptidoglycan lipid II flippase